jgi:uncharacterized protein
MEITGTQRAALAEIADRFDLRLILLFGSHVGGVTHAASDLDIAVQTRGGRGLPMETWLDLLAGFGAVFPGQSVDLAVVDRADPLFLKQIAGRCELLAGRERDLHELRMYAYRRYQDHKPYLAMERRFVEGLAGRSAAAG